MVLYGEKITI